MFLCFVLIILFFLSFLGDALQEKHYLHYKFTALSKANTFPEFSAEAVADGRQIFYFNNKDKSWVRESLTEGDWTKSLAKPPHSRDWFLYQLKTLSNCTNTQCSEIHVLQRKAGCEVEKFPDGTMNLTVFDEYGFDGEDFIAFDSDTLQWIDKNLKAKETKIKWDQQTGRNELLQHFLKTCMNWISTFNNTKKSPPDVHVFVRKAPDGHSKLVLSCLATGFYPRDIEMNIRLYRNIIKDQTSSGIRPNGDGSFQMRSSVEIDRNQKEFYDCFVIHSSTEPIVVEWAGNGSDCETESHWALKAVLILVSILVLIVILIAISYCVYQRKRLNGQTTSYGDQTGREMRTEHCPSYKGQMSSYDDDNGVKMRLHSDRGEMSSPESKRRERCNKNGSSPQTDISGSQPELRCEQLVFCRS